MAHYVLLFRGEQPTRADLDLIEQADDVTILDHSAARALLVDAPPHAVDRLRNVLDDWVVEQEVTHQPPVPARQTVRDEPDQSPE